MCSYCIASGQHCSRISQSHLSITWEKPTLTSLWKSCEWGSLTVDPVKPNSKAGDSGSLASYICSCVDFGELLTDSYGMFTVKECVWHVWLKPQLSDHWVRQDKLIWNVKGDCGGKERKEWTPGRVLPSLACTVNPHWGGQNRATESRDSDLCAHGLSHKAWGSPGLLSGAVILLFQLLPCSSLLGW